MAKTARLELRVDPELKARVEAEAGRLGQKVATFVERALVEKLDGGPTLVIDSSVLAAAKPVPLRFSPDEERAHAEARRRETSRQLMPAKPSGKRVFTPRPKGKA